MNSTAYAGHTSGRRLVDGPAASPWIRGVCAEIGRLAGVPVWVPRAAFLVFGLLHWFLAAVLYVVFVKVMAPPRRPAPASFGPIRAAEEVGGIRSRFASLDARLADLEAASLHQEASLRRQFRDL